MKNWRYTKGLHDLGNGHYAYLVPDGSWGWSNAGLIEDAGETLLVDTLFDLKLTREMLDTMKKAVPGRSQHRRAGQHACQRRPRLNFEIMAGCMVSTSLSMAPALLIAQMARVADLDGPLLLARDRPDGLRYDGSLVYPSDHSLWG